MAQKPRVDNRVLIPGEARNTQLGSVDTDAPPTAFGVTFELWGDYRLNQLNVFFFFFPTP